ncbi:hypothetical protein K501DRAFT_245224 [Backusella circina FSU 941]|nr:hypothetical protein K501DRAFT_245224 [Backusella circina FSU 941]
MQSAQTELDFINLYLESLSNKSVRYGDDYMQRALPKPLKIKRVPVINNTIEEPKPATNTTREVPENTNKFEVTVKVLKPAKQFTIGNLTSADTISQLKQRIYQQQTIPVQRQRLLIKGKVLADQKTLDEVSVKEGTTLHLMMTAAPTAAAAEVTTGRFGVSLEAETKLASPEFWEALEKTIVEQVGEADAKLVLSKVKASLTP